MKPRRALELFSNATTLIGPGGDTSELYAFIEAAIDELVGYKLLTILRLESRLLRRMHSSNPQSYPVGGAKDITDDAWLRTMLKDGVPVISADPTVVRHRFFDHETIFALGCEAVMNVPVTGPPGTLGSLNLLHKAGWFTPEHVLFARPFAALLALAWSGPTPLSSTERPSGRRRR